MTEGGRLASRRYKLIVAGPADRRISEKLPEAVAAAVVEFLTGDLLANPHRVGKQLGAPLEGIWSARRGTYRILYEIDKKARTVTVLDVDHRAGVYRGRGSRRR